MQDGVSFLGRLFKYDPYEKNFEDPLKRVVGEMRYALNRAARNDEWASQTPALWKALDTLETSEQTLCLLVLYKSPLWSALPQEIKDMVRTFVATQNRERWYANAVPHRVIGEIVNTARQVDNRFVDMQHFNARFERADGAHFDDDN